MVEWSNACLVWLIELCDTGSNPAAGSSEGICLAEPRLQSTCELLLDHSDTSVKAYTVNSMLWSSHARLDFQRETNYLCFYFYHHVRMNVFTRYSMQGGNTPAHYRQVCPTFGTFERVKRF